MSEFFKLGEVRVATDDDFNYFLHMCKNDDGWHLDYNKKSIKVWTKPSPVSDFKIIRTRCDLTNVSADDMYDLLHDAEYRKQWDKVMLDSVDICRIGPNSDISCYAMRSPPPFQNRDFVLHRVWLQTNTFSAIISHSVFHKKAPPKKNVIRGLTHLTGYLLIPLGPKSCTFYYLSQCDPGGSLPAWAVNKLTQIIVPSSVKRLIKAGSNYAAWKRTHNPHWKPWLFPEQMELPSIQWSDVLDSPDVDIKSQRIDETERNENDLDLTSELGDDNAE